MPYHVQPTPPDSGYHIHLISVFMVSDTSTSSIRPTLPSGRHTDITPSAPQLTGYRTGIVLPRLRWQYVREYELDR
ncbi:hypothetical protein M501DRAFT_995717 [Patellaria atrata CBS 101060]|uniref:Uncharacterized protein n=1 Tax=Patellaria atrata CBS 101060 TaxID=1346257 RepID=A0A9P4S8U5_9PEZI|nr:hypothetical protein M501DRAFT_995717 [Patellaria atrata CBS 101060]